MTKLITGVATTGSTLLISVAANAENHPTLELVNKFPTIFLIRRTKDKW